MKEMLEEYGGMIVVCFFALLFLTLIIVGTGERGMFGKYTAVSLEGTGTRIMNGDGR